MAHQTSLLEPTIRKRDIVVVLGAFTLLTLAGDGAGMLLMRLVIPVWLAYVVGVRRAHPDWIVASKTFVWTLIPWVLVLALVFPTSR